MKSVTPARTVAPFHDATSASEAVMTGNVTRAGSTMFWSNGGVRFPASMVLHVASFSMSRETCPLT